MATWINVPPMARMAFYLTVMTLIAGTTPFAARHTVLEMPAMTVAWARFGTAGLLLWLTVKWTGRWKPIDRSDWPRLLFVALLCVPINQIGFLKGLQWSTATHAALAYSLKPVLVFWMVWALGRNPFRWSMLAAAVLAFAGPAAATWPDLVGHDWRDSLTGSALGGDLLLLSAVLSWTMFVVFSRPLIQKYGAMRTLSLVFLVGTLCQTPLMLLDVGDFQLAAISWKGIGGFLFITLITGYLNYLLWYVVSGHHDVARASVVTNLHFVVTAIEEWNLSPSILIGCVLASAGVLLSSLSARGAVAPSAAEGGDSSTGREASGTGAPAMPRPGAPGPLNEPEGAGAA